MRTVHTHLDQYLDKHYPDNREEMFEKLSKWQPIGRMGKPGEIASIISCLVSDELHLCGSAYDVDGGTTLLGNVTNRIQNKSEINSNW